MHSRTDADAIAPRGHWCPERSSEIRWFAGGPTARDRQVNSTHCLYPSPYNVHEVGGAPRFLRESRAQNVSRLVFHRVVALRRSHAQLSLERLVQFTDRDTGHGSLPSMQSLYALIAD